MEADKAGLSGTSSLIKLYLELQVPVSVKVRKGEVTVTPWGKCLPAGWYEVTEDSRVVTKRLPLKLKMG